MPRNSGYLYRERIAADQCGHTLLGYLVRGYPHSAEEEWLRRIDAREILLDGRAADPGTTLSEGQLVTWARPPWGEPDVPPGGRILHEDEHVLAVDKPAGLPTLPGGGFLEGTLLARVRAHDPAAVPVHRLGRWTSGLVLFARTPATRSALARIWRTREVRKVYRALCTGDPPGERFPVEAAIGPVPHARLGTVHAASPAGRPAVSRFTVLERRPHSFLARVVIETGRPHQIRIHAAAAGCPLAGDPLYGAGGVPPDGCTALPGDPGYALHAHRLRLRHPATGGELDLVAEPPAELARGFVARPPGALAPGPVDDETVPRPPSSP